MGKRQKTSSARLQKTGPLSDRLSQVEMDRVFSSQNVALNFISFPLMTT